MRVALVHSFYRADVPSGENTVVNRQVDALRDAGHDVLLVARRTDDLSAQDRFYPLRSALTVATGHGPDPTAEISGFRPDVVHVHNLFPNLGDSWVSGWAGPLVITLHNFRTICANALLFRDGAACTQCLPGGRTWHAVAHGCYRGSRAATLPLAISSAGGVGRNRLVRRADRVIALSERSKSMFCASGGPGLADRIDVIPNGVPDRGVSERIPRTHWAFVGRLSAEKGVRELLDVWPADEPLMVLGDGPELAHLKDAAPPSVQFLGTGSTAQVDAVLRRARGLLMPSRCFENFPTVLAEALMHGTPVVALDGNVAADFVRDHGCGATYSDAGGLESALRAVRSDASLAGHCRRTYVERLALGPWVERLIGVYRAAGAGS